LLIAGDVKFGEGEYMNRVDELIRELDIADYIENGSPIFRKNMWSATLRQLIYW